MDRENMRLTLQSASNRLKEVFERLKQYTTFLYDMEFSKIEDMIDYESFNKYFNDFYEICDQEFKIFISSIDVETKPFRSTEAFTMTTSYLKDVTCDAEFEDFVKSLAFKVCSEPIISFGLANVDDSLLDYIESMIYNEEYLTEHSIHTEIDEILNAIKDVEESIRMLDAADEYIRRLKVNQLSYWSHYVELRKEREERYGE